MILATGARVAQYEIVGPLGSGGMGEVYRAHDSRLDRDVAIKVLSEHLAGDPEMRARFEREAKSIAALSHPGILAIHELAIVNDRSFAVMELLEGESLGHRIARGPIPWRRAVEIAAEIADALAAAHARGILHRDLKPENVFLTGDERVKILDFGLARSKGLVAMDSEGATATLGVTRPGTILGTIGYMAPEQVRGATADAPADLFALGCILCEMVTGRKAFGRDSAAETLAAILHDEVPGLVAEGEQLPPALGRVVAHCLEKDPARRFQSARDVALALRAILADSEINPRAAAPRRRRTAVKSLAVLPLVNLKADPQAEHLTDGITESIINSLSQLPKLRVIPRSTVFRYRGPDVDPRTVGLALNVSTLVTGRVVQRGDSLNIQVELVDVETESQIWGDQYSFPVSNILAVQGEIAWQISEALRLRLTGEQKKRLTQRPTASSEAYQHYLRGRHHWNKWTGPDFQRAIEHFERAIESDPAFALAYSGLSDTYGAMGYYGFLSPTVAFPRARAAAERALELDERLAEARTTMGVAHLFYDWDWPAAEQEFRRAIELNPRYASARSFYALFLSTSGRFEEALAEAIRGRELDPLSTINQASVAWALFTARKFEQALDQVRATLELEPGLAEANTQLITIYEQLGHYEKAARAMDRMLPFFGQTLTRTDRLLQALTESGPEGYWRMRLQLMQELATSARYVPPYAFALLHGRLGELDRAFEWLDRMIQDRSGQAVFLGTDPAADPLRADPRFGQTLHRISPVLAATLSPAKGSS